VAHFPSFVAVTVAALVLPALAKFFDFCKLKTQNFFVLISFQKLNEFEYFTLDLLLWYVHCKPELFRSGLHFKVLFNMLYASTCLKITPN